MTEERSPRSIPFGGDPAFPTQESNRYESEKGLSKREHFAVLLLAGMNANPDNKELCHADMIDLALNQTEQLLKALSEADRGDS